MLAKAKSDKRSLMRLLSFEDFQTLTETFHKCSPIIITIYKVAIKFQILTSWSKKTETNTPVIITWMIEITFIGLLSLIIQTYSAIYYHIQKNRILKKLRKWNSEAVKSTQNAQYSTKNNLKIKLINTAKITNHERDQDFSNRDETETRS